jgi:class 3 adenylate cyclase
MCIFDTYGAKLFENDAYVASFKGFDMFGHVVGCKGTCGNAWTSKIVHNSSSYDINILMGVGPGTYCVIADDVNEYVTHENETASFHNQHIRFIKSLYPKHITDAIFKQDLTNLARHHKGVTICFADIRGFTSTCSRLAPEDVMQFLNHLFGLFDVLLKKHGLFKLETVGDCYVSVAGLMAHNDDGENVLILDGENDASIAAENMVEFARDMIQTAFKTRIPGTNQNVELRVGIHTGDVMSGIIDNAMPKFCLFGDAMNMASRMESAGRPMHIHVSDATYGLLKSNKSKEGFGRLSLDIKGKGEMTTHLMSCASRLTWLQSQSTPNMTNTEKEPELAIHESSSLTNLMKFVNLVSISPTMMRKSLDATYV